MYTCLQAAADVSWGDGGGGRGEGGHQFYFASISLLRLRRTPVVMVEVDAVTAAAPAVDHLFLTFRVSRDATRYLHSTYVDIYHTSLLHGPRRANNQ